MSNILQFFYVYSLFCPFSDWTGPGTELYNMVYELRLVNKIA